MPFVRRGEEPPKRDERLVPIITDEMRLRWMLLDAERYRREEAEQAVAEAERILKESK
jgi:hypothetical protein